jgi:hypothetical protein
VWITLIPSLPSGEYGENAMVAEGLTPELHARQEIPS